MLTNFIETLHYLSYRIWQEFFSSTPNVRDIKIKYKSVSLLLLFPEARCPAAENLGESGCYVTSEFLRRVGWLHSLNVKSLWRLWTTLFSIESSSCSLTEASGGDEKKRNPHRKLAETWEKLWDENGKQEFIVQRKCMYVLWSGCRHHSSVLSMNRSYHIQSAVSSNRSTYFFTWFFRLFHSR